ncbi:MAG: catecholate siderophore receptor Fiu [Syntrophaceae bacterium PtaU1.Bin231]|nr:MAG: catecholate siderophore receptor Fiu [Syntrophaceae bacterium PtaU1.Bin231]
MPGVKPPAGTEDYYRGGVKFYNGDSATLLNHSEDKDGQAVAEIKGKPVKWLGYDLKGYYTKMISYNYERYASDGTGAENWITNRVLGADGHLDIRPFEGAGLLLGGEYKDFTWKNEAISLNSSGEPKTGIKTETAAHLYSHGVFTEAQYRPSKYVKGLVGLRHEDHSTFGSENLPLFGLVVNPFSTTALKFNHGKHFLAPTPNDLYWPADPYTRGNPNLKPEIGWHTDVTAEQSLLDSKVFLTASYFHWNVDNKIQWEPDSNGVWSPINLAGYVADGIEAGVKAGPFYNLTLSLAFTYLKAEEENRQYTRQDYGWPPAIPADFQYAMVKRQATMTPERLFKGDLTYKSDFGLTASATVRFVGDRIMYKTESTTYPDTRTVAYTLDSYWTVDMKVQQRLYKHWLLTLSGNNLLDRAYDTHLTTFTNQATSRTTMCGYPGAGRSVFLSVAYEY